MTPTKKLSRNDYAFLWIAPLDVEQLAALSMLDEEHQPLSQPRSDENCYYLGSIGGYNVVIASLHDTSNSSAAAVVSQARMTFPNLVAGLLVGIGGGVPVNTDQGPIRLGHVIVSKANGPHPGVVEYDRGSTHSDHFERRGALPRIPRFLLTAAAKLESHRERNQMSSDPVWQNTKRIETRCRRPERFKYPGIECDHLYESGYEHLQKGKTCRESRCDPSKLVDRPAVPDGKSEPFITVHRGTVGTGGLVVRDAMRRDSLSARDGTICFETEAAGSLEGIGCLCIRGVSDYADSHKNDLWRGWAAIIAAAYARQLFFHIPFEDVQSDLFAPILQSGASGNASNTSRSRVNPQKFRQYNTNNSLKPGEWDELSGGNLQSQQDPAPVTQANISCTQSSSPAVIPGVRLPKAPKSTAWASFIHRALMSTDNRTMTYKQLYEWLEANDVEEKCRGNGWKTSVKVNISKNDSFQTYVEKSPILTPTDIILEESITFITLRPFAEKHGVTTTRVGRYRSSRS